MRKKLMFSKLCTRNTLSYVDFHVSVSWFVNLHHFLSIQLLYKIFKIIKSYQHPLEKFQVCFGYFSRNERQSKLYLKRNIIKFLPHITYKLRILAKNSYFNSWTNKMTNYSNHELLLQMMTPPHMWDFEVSRRRLIYSNQNADSSKNSQE